MELYVVLVDIVSNFCKPKTKSDAKHIYAKSGEVCSLVSVSGDVYICEKVKKVGTTYKLLGDRFPVLKSKLRKI